MSRLNFVYTSYKPHENGHETLDVMAVVPWNFSQAALSAFVRYGWLLSVY